MHYWAALQSVHGVSLLRQHTRLTRNVSECSCTRCVAGYQYSSSDTRVVRASERSACAAREVRPLVGIRPAAVDGCCCCWTWRLSALIAGSRRPGTSPCDPHRHCVYIDTSTILKQRAVTQEAQIIAKKITDEENRTVNALPLNGSSVSHASVTSLWRDLVRHA